MTFNHEKHIIRMVLKGKEQAVLNHIIIESLWLVEIDIISLERSLGS